MSRLFNKKIIEDLELLTDSSNKKALRSASDCFPEFCSPENPPESCSPDNSPESCSPDDDCLPNHGGPACDPEDVLCNPSDEDDDDSDRASISPKFS